MKDITSIEEIKQICFDWDLCKGVIFDIVYENIKIDTYFPNQIFIREEHIIVELEDINTEDIIEREITYKELSEAVNQLNKSNNK